jgi:uncharacterized protein
MKVVLDTNVLISGIFFGGVPGNVLDAWMRGRFEIYVTPKILSEYESVLCFFAREETQHLQERWLVALSEHVHYVMDPALYPKVCRDPHDDKFLYCAAVAQVDYLVTGDKDLKTLQGSCSFKILSPRSFLSVLGK